MTDTPLPAVTPPRLQIVATAYPTSNQIVVTLDALGHGALQLRAGKPSSPVAGRSSQLNLWFENVIADQSVNELRVMSPGWAAATFIDASGKTYLALSPEQDVTISADRRQEIILTKAPITDERLRAVLMAEYHNIPSDGERITRTAHVPCHFVAESQSRLNLLMSIDTGNVIVADRRPHTMRLAIRNLDEVPLVIAGPLPPHAPVGLTLKLEVVMEAALTNRDGTVTETGSDITVSVANNNYNDWTVLTRHEGARLVHDLVGAPVDGGHGHVLNTGEGSIVTFDIGGIRADRPGTGHLILRYNGVQGYGSGEFIVPFYIVPFMEITSFNVTSPAGGQVLYRRETDVTLTYAAANARALAVRVVETGEEKTLAVPAGSVSFKVKQSSTFVLTARSPSGLTDTRTCRVTMPEHLHGMIMMWSGQSDQIPPGWALCDGRTIHDFPEPGKNIVTPDLCDKFVLGAGSARGQEPHRKGGTKSHTHGKLSGEYMTTIEGRHSHKIPESWKLVWMTMGTREEGYLMPHLPAVTDSNNKIVTDFRQDYPQFSVKEAGEHNHKVSIALDTPSSDHLPLYYSLCFIMKL